MFVMTAKISKTKLAAAAVVLVAVVLVVVLLVTGSGGKKASLADAPVGATNDERVAYLATFGWSVNAEPKEVQKIRIPESSDNKVFARYNELQRSQGFDLTGFGGKEAMRYVYEILNYPNAAAPVYASVIVYDGHIIGGDITNSAPEGKIHGFKMPGTAPETSSESVSESSSGASGESTEPSEPSESTAPETTEPTVSSAS